MKIPASQQTGHHPGKDRVLRAPNPVAPTPPINIYWGPWSVLDVDIHSDVVQRTLREGRVSDQVAMLNRSLLVKI